MKLDSLSPVAGSVTKRKRRGRGHGSGLGKSAGRGDKGAGQRSGFKRRAWFEGGQMPLARRLPKKGFKNNFKKEFQIVNISKLEGLDTKSIDPQVLYDNGLVRSSLKPVKILGNGNLTKKLKISGVEYSNAASKKIQKLGGDISEK